MCRNEDFRHKEINKTKLIDYILSNLMGFVRYQSITDEIPDELHIRVLIGIPLKEQREYYRDLAIEKEAHERMDMLCKAKRI